MSLSVLILEDDNSLAESLKEFFSNAGFTVTLSSNVKDAKQNVLFGQYDLLLVDLVLPKVNGMDFLQSIITNKKLSSNCKIWVISGVLKKRILPKYILSRVDGFFSKPLDFKLIKSKINSSFVFAKKDTVFNFFYENNQFSVQNLFDKSRVIESHQLMFIYFYLFRRQFTGVINLSYIDNEQVTVFFKGGHITHVIMDDKSSHLGVLLLKRKLASVDQIKNLLRESSDKGLGEKMVLNHICKEEDVQNVLREQQLIRLYKSLGKGRVIVTSRKDMQTPVSFNKNTLLSLKDLLSILDNWIYFKVGIDWLKNFFTFNAHCTLQPVGQVESSKMGEYSKMVQSILNKPLRSETVIHDIVNKSPGDRIFYEMYVRLLIRNCILRDSQKSKLENTNYETLRNKLQSEFTESNRKSYFDWLNVSQTADSSEIEKQYKVLVKMIHADRRNKNLPKDIELLYDKYFIAIKKSYAILIDEGNRKKYILSLNEQMRDEVNSKYAVAKKKLENEKYKEAFKLFEVILKSGDDIPNDVVLYCIWAYLKLEESKLSSAEDVYVSKLFEKVLPDQSQSALFFFIKGLYMKRKGNMQAAYNFTSKAIEIDSQLFMAYRERHAIAKRMKKNKKSLFDFLKLGA